MMDSVVTYVLAHVILKGYQAAKLALGLVEGNLPASAQIAASPFDPAQKDKIDNVWSPVKRINGTTYYTSNLSLS